VAVGVEVAVAVAVAARTTGYLLGFSAF
jgi:hypothetical protein